MSTVGEILKTAREAKGLTASELAQRTRIKRQQVEGLERDDFSVSPAPMYTKGFLKLLAQELDLNPAELLARFEDQLAQDKPQRPAARVPVFKAPPPPPPPPVPESPAPAAAPEPMPALDPLGPVAEEDLTPRAPPRRIPVRGSLRPAGSIDPDHPHREPRAPRPPREPRAHRTPRARGEALAQLRTRIRGIRLPAMQLPDLPPALRRALLPAGGAFVLLLALTLTVRACSAARHEPPADALLIAEPRPILLPLPTTPL